MVGQAKGIAASKSCVSCIIRCLPRLAVEHFTEDNTIWPPIILASESLVLRRGEAGRVYFYQNELPYDVDQADKMRCLCIRWIGGLFWGQGLCRVPSGGGTAA